MRCLVKALVLIAIVVIAAVVLFPVGRPPERVETSKCATNLKLLSLALAQYRDDFDDRLPLVNGASQANQRPFGWADALAPYLKSPPYASVSKRTGREALHCPTEKNLGSANPTRSGYTDYWFNRNLNGMAAKQLKDPAQTIAFGDGNDGTDVTNARYSLNALPSRWLNNANAPACRHYYQYPHEHNVRGANYAFADGHITSRKPEQITTTPPAPGVYTFAPR